MQEVSKMFKAADILVAEERHRIFTNRTQKRIDLVLNFGNTQILVDVLRLMLTTLLMDLYGLMD